MSIPKAPNELEIVRTTWNQFEIVLAGQKIPQYKLPAFPIRTSLSTWCPVSISKS
jgi:hypothetical protein